MAVVADFCEERLVQIQRVNYASRSEIKDAANSFGQECVVIVSALLRVDLDGNRLCLPNGIGEADRTHIGKTRRDNVLCHISCHICAAAVDFRAVLSGKRTAAVGYKPAVGVDHQLAAGETGISFKAAQHKSARRIDENLRLLVDAHVMAGAGNDQPAEFLTKLVRVFVCIMLAGDHDGVHALRNTKRILHGHLRFAVRPDAGDQFFLPAGGEQARDTVRQHNRRGQQFHRFPTGIAVHDALIACAERIPIDRTCNIGALRMQTHLYMIITVVSGILNNLPDNGFHVRMRCRMQFSGNKNFARRRQYFTGNAGIGIFFEAGVQNAVRNRVAEFVRMACRDGLCRQDVFIFHASIFLSSAD